MKTLQKKKNKSLKNSVTIMLQVKKANNKEIEWLDRYFKFTFTMV